MPTVIIADEGDILVENDEPSDCSDDDSSNSSQGKS